MRPFGISRRLCHACLSQRRIDPRPPHPLFLSPQISSYATNTRAPRDRSIDASTINFIDEHGDFRGPHSLASILSSYDASSHTLINLTPTQAVPTCRLYTRTALREMEGKAYAKRREKAKIGADPSKVLKECNLNWTVTQHDLAHKLDPCLSALRKGNKVDIQIGTKTKRHARGTPDKVREDLVQTVTGHCAQVGKEWKRREGNLETGVILHFLGTPQEVRAKGEHGVEDA